MTLDRNSIRFASIMHRLAWVFPLLIFRVWKESTVLEQELQNLGKQGKRKQTYSMFQWHLPHGVKFWPSNRQVGLQRVSQAKRETEVSMVPCKLTRPCKKWVIISQCMAAYWRLVFVISTVKSFCKISHHFKMSKVSLETRFAQWNSNVIFVTANPFVQHHILAHCHTQHVEATITGYNEMLL